MSIFERDIVIHVGFSVTIFLSHQRDGVMGFTPSLSTSGRSFKKNLKRTRPTHAQLSRHVCNQNVENMTIRENIVDKNLLQVFLSEYMGR